MNRGMMSWSASRIQRLSPGSRESKWRGLAKPGNYFRWFVWMEILLLFWGWGVSFRSFIFLEIMSLGGWVVKGMGLFVCC
ncbi:hypothetical protein BDV34DRAFT_192979 [Aspergillus parasiticus]|uniref:Uncharacterized protein n=1 Tax=Aspergillus parasiticus TaxID=5067 RepID=A0A5N6DP14_ASPPA|nr:hypothetical protein BDV34DRAFT_192979 [Aspergillus parasiticus]